MKYLTSAIQFIAANQGNEEAIGAHLATLLDKMNNQIDLLESQRRILRELVNYPRLSAQLKEEVEE